MSWNEALRSKLRGITELEPSELLEIFRGALPHPEVASPDSQFRSRG